MRFPRTFLVLTLAGQVLAIGAPARADGPYPCIPPPSSTGATCAFDIWGYVRDATGSPVAGATVSDGGVGLTTTGADGYYHLVEPQQGRYTLRASVRPSCYVDGQVSHSVLNGGYVEGSRFDFSLACA